MSGNGRSGVCQVPEGSGEQRKREETDGGVFCDALTTLMVKGQVKETEEERKNVFVLVSNGPLILR